ncbi:MAG: hypothetical protein HY319_30175 [Armatimonadetes bacterium]|nr:hypothetical protein [Armatimonadota bacterium]
MGRGGDFLLMAFSTGLLAFWAFCADPGAPVDPPGLAGMLLGLTALGLELTAARLPGFGFASPSFGCYLAMAMLNGLGFRMAALWAGVCIGLRTLLRGRHRSREAVADLLPVLMGLGVFQALGLWWGVVAASILYLAAVFQVPRVLVRALPEIDPEYWRAIQGRAIPLYCSAGFLAVAMAMALQSDPVRGAWLLPVPALLAWSSRLKPVESVVGRRSLQALALSSAEGTARDARNAEERLRGDLHRKVEECIVLKDLAKRLSRGLEVEGVLASLLQMAPRLVECRSVGIFIDSDGTLERIRWQSPPESEPLPELVEQARGGSIALFPLIGQEGPSAMAAPMGDQGVLYVARSDDTPFSTDETHLLSIVADVAATALRSARVHEETVEAYRKLRESEAQLVQSSKMAAVGQLAAGVAHELNTPLGAVLLSIDSALEHLERGSSKPAADKLTGAAEAILQAQTVIDKLLSYSRGASDEAPVPADLNQVVRDALQLVRRQLELDGVRVILEEGKIPAVRCRSGEVQQILMNLLLNSKDALLESGRSDRPIRIVTASDQNHAMVKVIDEGSGIPTEAQARVFDPFFTTKPTGSGTGLGLSVSAQLAARNGASLTFETSPGGGTTFILRMPA